jgi:aminopeptidase N
MPVCFKTGGTPRCEVIDMPSQSTKGAGCNNLFANAGARGYYLTDYSPDAARSLARSASGLLPVERLSFVGDEWWMVRSGRHDIDVYLDLAGALSTDDTPTVLASIATRLSFTAAYLAGHEQQARFEAWVRTRFGPALNALALPGAVTDDDQRQSRRATLLTIVGVTGNDPGVQRRARELAQDYIENPSSLSPTLAPTVLQVAAMAGDQALYDRYVAQIRKNTSNTEEYYRFFNALAWFRDPALVKRTLDFAASSDVRTQDTGLLIASLMARPWSREATWVFVKAQWPALVQRLGTFQGIPEIVGSLDTFCSADAAADIKQFFAMNPVPSSARGLQQAEERVETCAAMRSRQAAPLARWLASAK